MTVSRVDFTNWRNLGDCSIELDGGINVLYGMNAQGKSNILEGIYYFARGRSFRGAHDRELIGFGGSFAKTSLSFRREGYENDTKLEIVIPKNGKKQLFRAGAAISSMSEMLGCFRAVLFCPAHLSLVTGGPLERRTFLDIAISQLSPLYLNSLRRYSRVLAERNMLLKRASAGEAVTDAEWEVYAKQLSYYGSWVTAFRAEYTGYLNDAVAGYFDDMTDGREKPELVYSAHSLYEEMPKPMTDMSKEPKDDVLYEKLMSNIDRETIVGSTLWGCHKDDIKITLNGKDAKLFASQGQQRSIVLSLKLAEAEISRSFGGEYPAVLLDDVFSELDESRRKYILDSIDGRQIIVTSCEPDIIPSGKTERAAFRRIEQGTVKNDV